MDFTDYRWWLWLLISFSLAAILTIISIKKKFSLEKSANIMAIACIISEVSKIYANMKLVDSSDALEGMYLKPGALPFHLCSILIFAIMYISFGRNEKIKSVLCSFMTPIGIFGSFIAILMATCGIEFWAGSIADTIDVYQSFLYHAFLMWFCLYLYITKNASLGLKDYKRNIILLLILFFLSIWINSILSVYETNFFFTVKPPMKGLPYLNLNHGWLVYVAHMMSLGFILVTTTHLKGIIKDIKEMKNKKEII